MQIRDSYFCDDELAWIQELKIDNWRKQRKVFRDLGKGLDKNEKQTYN